jgi:hypothetical protein
MFVEVRLERSIKTAWERREWSLGALAIFAEVQPEAPWTLKERPDERWRNAIHRERVLFGYVGSHLSGGSFVPKAPLEDEAFSQQRKDKNNSSPSVAKFLSFA